MPASVRFRPIAEDDYQAVCDLIPSEEELFLIYAQGTYPLTFGQMKHLVEIRMEPTVLVHDEKVAGFANFYSYRKGRSVVIGNVVIDPALRGQSLGKQLVSHMIKRAFDEYDLPRVRIHVYNRNLRALLLYGSLGFRPTAMRPQKDYKGDPVMLLTLRLRRDDWLPIEDVELG